MPIKRRWAALCAAAMTMCGPKAFAAELDNPPRFEAAGAQLNLLMSATSKAVDFDGTATTGWVYEVCQRASPTATTCLPGAPQSPYGGVWLHLKPNDTLNIRLQNNLPPVPDAKHCVENPDLANNPTNLHTHGLIVEPHRSIGGSDPYGDYVFLEIRKNAPPVPCAPSPAATAGEVAPTSAAQTAHGHGTAGGGHPDMDVADGAAEYAINLVNHPPGLFWFHPHMHGLALNQVTAGMAGVITVGEPSDECDGDGACVSAVSSAKMRLLVLKDSQVASNGTLINQLDPAFCPANPAAGEAPRKGVCAGDPTAHPGGHWFHTINGQVFPSIPVGPQGDLWRIVNAAASRSYDLSLTNGSTDLPMQVLSIDGITIDATLAANLPMLQSQLGRKMEVFRCPDPPAAKHGDAVCTRHVRMFPSARVTLRILNDQATMQQAVLRTADFSTGPNADDWPAIDLASVTLAPPADGLMTALPLRGHVTATLSASGALGSAPSLLAPGGQRPMPLDQAQQQAGQAAPAPATAGLHMATEFAIDSDLKMGRRQDPRCANLGPGEHRRIYFGTPDKPPGAPEAFGLATSVVDAQGKEKPGTLTPMQQFNPAEATVCLTASRSSGHPTREIWELINLTGEDHNFHIHQTRFWLMSNSPEQPGHIDDAAVLQDNVPVPHAAQVDGCTGKVVEFNHGCSPVPVKVRIPFTQIGDFVFHCHILEHEDGGMMARIRVVAPRSQLSAK
jgi:FtsP/CotA-like multicopper oxidase with cupredoxin domain